MAYTVTRRPGGLATGSLLLAVLLGWPALAQTLVVPDLSGDARGFIQWQLEKGLRAYPGVEVVPRVRYERLAGRKGFRGARASLPAAVRAAADGLGLDAAVLGRVGQDVLVRVVDDNGDELLTRELTLRKGRLVPAEVSRLALDIAAALTSPPRPLAAASAPRPAEATPMLASGASRTAQPAPAVGTVSAESRGRQVAPAVTAAASAARPAAPPPTAPASAAPETSAPATSAPVTSAPAPRPAAPAEVTAVSTSQRPHADPAPTAARPVGPRLAALTLAGSTTWRSHCAVPGAASCAAYRALAVPERPAGRSVDFSTGLPYAGAMAQLELFPLVLLGDTPLAGLGVLAAFGLGSATVGVSHDEGAGSESRGIFRGVDRGLTLMGTYRSYFALERAQGVLPAYVGLRAGLLGRTFALPAEAVDAFPGSTRSPLAAGLDVSVPLSRLVRVEASGLYVHRPLPALDEWQRLGAGVSSRGFGAELGLAGDLVGPVGYHLRYRLLRFTDRLSGPGVEWANGGHVEELYSGFTWGVTVSL